MTPAASRAEPAERRQISVLFCDLVDSAALSARLDPEEFGEVLGRYQGLSGSVIARFEGYVAQLLGDGVLAYFGYPIAMEDGPRRAIKAGLALVEEVRQLSQSIFRSRAINLHVRVGIHTGPTVVGHIGGVERTERLAVGATPNLAARIQEQAMPDTVVVSDETARLAKGFFQLLPLGGRRLKGFDTAIDLYQVLGETDARHRLDASAEEGLTPFIGREQEIKCLRDRWDDARHGMGPVVLLGGEPGIGKSRQLRALKADIASKDCLWLEGFCSPVMRSSALHPIVEMIERQLGFARGMSAEDRLARIEAEVKSVGIDTHPAVALLAILLGLPPKDGEAPLAMTPQRQRQATFDILLSWLAASTRRYTVVLVLEDLHWADPSTLEFLGLALERQSPGPLMILLTHRLEFRPPWSHQRITIITLQRLGAGEAQMILQETAGRRVLPPQVAEQILAKADGVPLYLEEITKAVLEGSGAQGSHESKPGQPVALTIPPTIEDSLVSRLDRLGPSKGLVQLAATLGRVVAFDLLLAVSGEDESRVRASLETAVSAELLLRRDSLQRERYVFKHALIQDSAYESLLRTTRQDYHQRIASVLVQQFSDVAKDQPELLAQHYDGAGMTTPAIDQWARAGHRAVERSAYSEATEAFRRALSLLESLPPSEERDRREILLRSGLGLALLSIRGFSSEEVESTYARARELCERYGDVPMRVLFGIWAVNIVRGDIDATNRLATIMDRIIDGSRDQSEILIAHASLATRAFHAGEYVRSREHASRGIPFLDRRAMRAQHELLMRDYGYEGLLYSHFFCAWSDFHLGNIRDALTHSQEGLDIAAEIGYPYLNGMARMYAAAFAHDVQDPTQTGLHAGIGLPICADFPFWLAVGKCLAGWAEMRQGAMEAGILQIKAGLDLLRAIGGMIIVPYYMCYLAEAYLRVGQAEDGLKTIEDALDIASRNVCRGMIPELLRLKGELLIARDQLDMGEQHLRRSLDLSRSQGSKLFSLNAALPLADLLAKTARLGEARLLMAEAYAPFSLEPEVPLARRAKEHLDSLVGTD